MGNGLEGVLRAQKTRHAVACKGGNKAIHTRTVRELAQGAHLHAKKGAGKRCAKDAAKGSGDACEHEVFAIASGELEELYPDLTPHERENVFVKKHKTACIMQIGGALKNGKPHDGRAPDYDDWDLNCDILFWNEVLERAFEVSSMGIRVDAQSLARQLKLAGCEERSKLPFHKMLLADELPLTIGGGIGQSRLCMLMMGCAHIGEVQSSIWDEQTVKACEEHGIPLL